MESGKRKAEGRKGRVAEGTKAAAGRAKWSPQQNAVWEREEEYWVYRSKARVPEYKALFHPDFVGWPGRSEVPLSKVQLRGAVGREFRTARIVAYELTPLSVCVHDGFAIAYYFAMLVQKGSSGRSQSSRHRFTHVWKREGKSWMLIGGNSYKMKRGG